MDGINSKSAWELTQRLVKVNFDNRIAARGRKPDWIAELDFGNPISGPLNFAMKSLNPKRANSRDIDIIERK